MNLLIDQSERYLNVFPLLIRFVLQIIKLQTEIQKSQPQPQAA